MGCFQLTYPSKQRAFDEVPIFYFPYLGERSPASKKCEKWNHLGNVLTVISDKVIPHQDPMIIVPTIDYFLADIRQSSDYSPFGVQLSGRNFTLTGSEEYRMGFQGQEEDDEIKGDGNSVNYTFRMHDPRLGRFFAIDPLSGIYPHNSPYAFSENRVIDCIEMEGLEKVSVNTFSFAPFDTFGSLFHGDGDDRKFGDAIVTTSHKENYRIGGTVTVNLATGNSATTTYTTTTAQYNDVTSGGEICTSYSKLDIDGESGSKNKWSGNIHNYGWDCAIKTSCSIDTYADIEMVYTEKAKNSPLTGGWLWISGNVEGDRFPSNENFITDDFGNRVMLGVSGVDSENKTTAPYTELCGNATNEQMSTWDLTIEMDGAGKFEKVWLGTKSYSLSTWNSYFKSADPRSSDTNTDVDSSKGTITGN